MSSQRSKKKIKMNDSSDDKISLKEFDLGSGVKRMLLLPVKAGLQ